MQELSVTIAINSISIIILLILLLSYRKNVNILLPDQRLFCLLLYTTLALGFFDTVTFLCNSVNTPLMHVISWISNIITCSFNPVAVLVWLYYVDYSIYSDTDRLKRITPYVITPAIINIVLALSTPLTGLYFHISDINVYSRGMMLCVPFALSFAYFVFITVDIVKNYKRIGKKTAMSLIGFMIFPVVGAALQLAFYGLSLIWISATLSELITFIYLQNNIGVTDSLTGISNRRHLEMYLAGECKKSDGKLLAGLMLDVNDFKLINDSFGHSAGDAALVEIARILRASSDERDFVSRYAGDEFVIICKADSIEQVDALVSSIKAATEAENKTGRNPYKLSLSIGYAIFDYAKKETMDDFFRDIDAAMYEDKKRYKARKRKESASGQ